MAPCFRTVRDPQWKWNERGGDFRSKAKSSTVVSASSAAAAEEAAVSVVREGGGRVSYHVTIAEPNAPSRSLSPFRSVVGPPPIPTAAAAETATAERTTRP